MKGERRPGAQPCYYCLLIKYQCEKLDVLADEVVAKVLHDDVAVTSLDTLVVDTDHHGGVGLLDAAARRSLPSSQALTGDASDGDELPVPNFNAARRNGAGIGEPRDENLSLVGVELWWMGERKARGRVSLGSVSGKRGKTVTEEKKSSR